MSTLRERIVESSFVKGLTQLVILVQVFVDVWIFFEVEFIFRKKSSFFSCSGYEPMMRYNVGDWSTKEKQNSWILPEFCWWWILPLLLQRFELLKKERCANRNQIGTIIYSYNRKNFESTSNNFYASIYNRDYIWIINLKWLKTFFQIKAIGVFSDKTDFLSIDQSFGRLKWI
jgi:hypothetical protein